MFFSRSKKPDKYAKVRLSENNPRLSQMWGENQHSSGWIRVWWLTSLHATNPCCYFILRVSFLVCAWLCDAEETIVFLFLSLPSHYKTFKVLYCESNKTESVLSASYVRLVFGFLTVTSWLVTYGVTSLILRLKLFSIWMFLHFEALRIKS